MLASTEALYVTMHLYSCTPIPLIFLIFLHKYSCVICAKYQVCGHPNVFAYSLIPTPEYHITRKSNVDNSCMQLCYTHAPSVLFEIILRYFFRAPSSLTTILSASVGSSLTIGSWWDVISFAHLISYYLISSHLILSLQGGWSNHRDNCDHHHLPHLLAVRIPYLVVIFSSISQLLPHLQFPHLNIIHMILIETNSPPGATFKF